MQGVSQGKTPKDNHTRFIPVNIFKRKSAIDVYSKVKIARGFWVQPKVPLRTEKERQAFILEMRHKFNLL